MKRIIHVLGIAGSLICMSPSLLADTSLALNDDDFAYLRGHRYTSNEAQSLTDFAERKTYAEAIDRAERSARDKRFSHISLAELYALLHYTYDGRAENLNQALRSGRVSEEHLTYVRLINSALNKMPESVRKQGTVYRGVELSSEQQSFYRTSVGRVIRERGLVSTLDRDKVYSSESMPYLGRSTIFVIQSKNGVKTYPSGGMWGDEVLFRAGTRFRVLSARLDDNPITDSRPGRAGQRKFVVRLEELNDRDCQPLDQKDWPCFYWTVGLPLLHNPDCLKQKCCARKCGEYDQGICRCPDGTQVSPLKPEAPCSPE